MKSLNPVFTVLYWQSLQIYISINYYAICSNLRFMRIFSSSVLLYLLFMEANPCKLYCHEFQWPIFIEDLWLPSFSLYLHCLMFTSRLILVSTNCCTHVWSLSSKIHKSVVCFYLVLIPRLGDYLFWILDLLHICTYVWFILLCHILTLRFMYEVF